MRPVLARALLASLTLCLGACGRSSLLDGGSDCPPGAICIIDDGGVHRDGGTHDGGLHDGGAHDMASDAGRGDLGPGACGTQIPCSDPMCEGKPQCTTPGQEVCNNGIDDNDNGLVDCADPACFDDPACKTPDGGPISDDGGVMACTGPGGGVDCARAPCNQLPVCLHQTCMPEIEFGTVTQHDYDQTRTFDTRGSSESFSTCAYPGGSARVGELTLTATTDVRLDFAQPTGGAHVVQLDRAGFGQLCDQNQQSCLDIGQAATSTHTYAALPAGTYYIIVQSFPGTQAATTVRLSTGKSSASEICNNGLDDDGNGLIDCADLACANSPECTTAECKPDLNLGALVVGAAPVDASFDTRTSSNRFHPTCAGASSGNDYVVRFTLHETAGILVNWTQEAGSDHVLSIFGAPGPGVACDGAGQQSCLYPGGQTGGSAAFQPRPPGDYLFIFKSTGPGKDGGMTISVSAFVTRGMEICNNGIDDDDNGLTDCDDPVCFGIDGCRPPVCLADDDLGSFSWNTTASVTVDDSGGTDYYSTACGQGGGKSRVLKLTVTQPMGLAFTCTEDKGSAVFQLTQQLQPLDACDANPINCADPQELPFGCNFVMPNVQPGTYHVLVESFKAGDEGPVELTIAGEQENVLEICNNGVDDDGNGLTDCADPSCFTSPYCALYACVAAKDLGLLPLDGSAHSATVQTSGSGDNTRATCTTAVGGDDADVDFQLPSKATLTVHWAQAGNHDFAIYSDVNDDAACSAGPNATCQKSAGASSGSFTLPALAGGKYHFVVDADAPGSEGGVVLQLSAVAAP